MTENGKRMPYLKGKKVAPADITADGDRFENIDALMALQSTSAKALAKLKAEHEDLHELCVNAGVRRAAELQSEGAEA